MTKFISKFFLIIGLVALLSPMAQAKNFFDGETVIVSEQYATVLELLNDSGFYSIQFNSNKSKGKFKETYIYKTSGCANAQNRLCVGDAVIYEGKHAQVIGYNNDARVSYVVRLNNNGKILAGQSRTWLELP